MVTYASTDESQTNSSSAPEHFYCPLNLEIMEDPVQSRSSGQTFERQAILEWIFAGNATCPLTRKPLRPANLVDNDELYDEISVWQKIRDTDAKLAQITLFVGGNSFPE